MRIFILISSLFLSLGARAQEYGFLIGVHQSNARTSLDNVSGNAVLNFDLGLAMSFELLPDFRFKTGAIYNERHVDFKNSAADQTTSYNFAFIDVPVNFQYNFTSLVGVYAGLVIGINVNDKVKVPTGTPAADPGAKSLIPLADLGLSFLFNDMIGFDLYYEHGLGDYASKVHDLNSFGGNVLYYF